MRINTNIIALTACNSLSTASKRTSQSIEKLSSGYKINSVRDNPVGSALSAKMKSQLKNLEKATQSTADGISVIGRGTVHGTENEGTLCPGSK